MSFFLNLLVASALGFLSGLGIGGGSLLIIWLMLVCKADYPAAKYINLMFFIPSALIATVIRLVQKKLPFRQVILAAISGCAAAAFFTALSSTWNTGLLRKFFGVLLLCASVRELTAKKQQENSSS